MQTTISSQPRLIHKLLKSMLFLIVACAVAFFGVIVPAQADIYKWCDAAGVIYYSNRPPADLASILEILPSQNIAPDSDAAPKAYYLSTPGGQTDDSFTISPDVLQELFNEQVQPAAALPSPSEESPDLAAFTMRLAEVEHTLQQEVETRMQWQQQYTQAQSVIKTLEQQNRTLNIALSNMEEEIDFLRGTVVASDMEVTALKQRIQPGQYVMLENTVAGVQEQVQAIALELENLNAPALSQKVAVLAADIRSMKIQQQPDYNLHLRLASLERDMQHIADTQPISSQAAVVLARLEDNGQALSNISVSHDQRLDEQQTQIAALQAELERLKTSSMPSENRVMVQNKETLPETTASLTSGIRIVPRIERRRTSLLVRMAIWLETPQPQMEE